MPDLSIIVPVYNEEDSLVELHRQISTVEKEMNQTFEIIFVDDGSSDNSWNVVKKLATANDNVKCIRFRRNFGKAAALRAGAAETQSPLVMTMDADLQDDPVEIPRFIEALGEDYDLISGWKEKRDDPLGKTLPSKVFNWMVGMMTGVKLHDHNCGFKLYRARNFRPREALRRDASVRSGAGHGQRFSRQRNLRPPSGSRAWRLEVRPRTLAKRFFGFADREFFDWLQPTAATHHRCDGTDVFFRWYAGSDLPDHLLAAKS